MKIGFKLIFVSLLIIGLQDCKEIIPNEPNQNNFNFEKKVIPNNLIVTHSTSKIKNIKKVNLRKYFYWENDYGTPLNQKDDVGTFIEIGFNFIFYGNSYDAFWVNSNGNVTFNGENWHWSHPDIPDGNNIIIAPLYGDFDPEKGGDVYVNKVGEGNRERIIITWAELPEYSPADDSNSFQLTLFHKKNIIVFGYNGLETDGINWAYSSPSVDGNMDVGISSGEGSYINTASGSDILNLDHSNVVYIMDQSGEYRSIISPSRSEMQRLGIL